MYEGSESPETQVLPTFKTLIKNIVLLAMPIILSQLAQIASGVVDIVMAGNTKDPTILSSISIGVAMWTPASIFLLGLLYSLTHKIGVLRGMGDEKSIPALTIQGLFIGIGGGVLLGILLYFGVEPLCKWMNITLDSRGGAIEYTQAIALGFPAIGLFFVLRFLLEASGGAGFVMLVVVASIAVKILLNSMLIYGAFGVEPMGVKGFGIASIITFSFMASTLALIVLRLRRFRPLWNRKIQLSDLDFKKIAKFLKQGFPIALSFFSDYVVMSVVILFIAAISSIATGAHQIALNIVTVLLMITSGVAMAGTILIANAAGSKDILTVQKIALACFSLNIAIAIFISLVLYVFNSQIVSLYQASDNISALATTLIKIATFLFVINVSTITLGFIFRGIGQPAIPLGVMFFSHWGISIPLGYILANTSWIIEPLGLTGWWYGLFVGLSVGSILLIGLLLPRLSLKG